MSGTAEIRATFRGTLGRFSLDAAFTVPARGVTGLFGPSGCGKSTVLRCIAGLEHLRDGSCTVAGEVWQDRALFRPPHRRPVGYVFQDSHLFPHLSVLRNLLYATKGRKPAAAGGIAFDEVVALLNLQPLLDRSPHRLSGGERQRVAIGRALLSQPKLLLMDEPLSALDRGAKEDILPFLERLHAALAIPALYVSHDMAELQRLADHLVLMASGRVVATGPLDALQTDPALPLAQRQDAIVTLDAVVTSYDAEDGLMTLDVAGTHLIVPAPPTPIGVRRRLSIAADDVSLVRGVSGASSILNVLPARIVSATESGHRTMTVLLGLGPDGAGPRLLARITHRSWRLLELAPSADVHAQVKSVALARGDGLPG